MNGIRSHIAACALALLSWAAEAAQHHVCYQGDPAGGQPTGIYACYDDAGGSCRVERTTTSMSNPTTGLPNMPAVTATRYTFSSFASYTAKIIFTDTSGAVTTRDCVVNANSSGMSASPGAELTGFMTDGSGLLTTAVWKLVAPEPASAQRLTLWLPGDFVAVGGGALGTDKPMGGLVVESTQPDLTGGASATCDWRCWSARTADLGYSDPHRTTVYAIGMRITGLRAAELKLALRGFSSGGRSRPASIARSQADMAVGAGFDDPSTLLSGSVVASTDGSISPALLGQYITMSAPVVEESYPGCAAYFDCKPEMPVIGWRAEAMDHAFPRPGTVRSAVLALPSTIVVAGKSWRVRGTLVSASSPAVVSAPAIDVQGLPAGFALTGIGATVDWCCNKPYIHPRPAGNLLWKLEPRPDLRGASVAAKDHIFYSPARITGHAIGVRLE